MLGMVVHAFNSQLPEAEASLVYIVISETANSYVERLCPSPQKIPQNKQASNKILITFYFLSLKPAKLTPIMPSLLPSCTTVPDIPPAGDSLCPHLCLTPTCLDCACNSGEPSSELGSNVKTPWFI